MTAKETSDTSVLPYFETHDGPSGSPHLLLLHGFLSSRAQWLPNLAGLTAFCQPVVVELLGHGRSPAPQAPQAYTIESYLAAFEEIRGRVGARNWYVCGQSFGAGLMIQYALRHRERVPGLIFTNSLSAMTPKDNPEREAQQQARIEAIRTGGREGLESIRIHPRHAKRLPEDAKRELVEDAGRISLQGVVHSWQTTSPELSIVDVLGQLPMPALLVNGRWEKRFQPMRDEAVRRLPGLTVVDLDGGHSVNLEAAEGFPEAVRTFLAGEGALAATGNARTASPAPRAKDAVARVMEHSQYGRQVFRPSLSVLDAVNFGTLVLGSCISLPVCGLRALRAGRTLTLNLPKPGIETSSLFCMVCSIYLKR